MYPLETRELAVEAVAAGFSLTEAAELAGCSRTAVVNWAKAAGVAPPPRKKAVHLPFDRKMELVARLEAGERAAEAGVTAAAVSEAGFESLEAAKDAGTAFVFMGHGTAHVAKVTYSQMQAQMQNLGYENVFIGTVEGEPEETSAEAVIEAVKAAGYTNVVLRPLMVVAGDHANNDMAGSDDDSWKTVFEAAGFTVDCQIHGLGEIADVQALYVAHTKAAIDALNA